MIRNNHEKPLAIEIEPRAKCFLVFLFFVCFVLPLDASIVIEKENGVFGYHYVKMILIENSLRKLFPSSATFAIKKNN